MTFRRNLQARKSSERTAGRSLSIRTVIENPGGAASSLAKTDASFRRRIRQVGLTIRDDLRAKLQEEAYREYPPYDLGGRAATGRFAEGLDARILTNQNTGESTIQVTVPNYRETRFITNVGGSGYFTFYPVSEYRINAKPGKTLRVPREPYELYQTNKPVTGPRRRFQAFVYEPEGVPKKLIYFYPRSVKHHGFRRDVVQDTIDREGPRYVDRYKQAVVIEFGPYSRNINIRVPSIKKR